MVGKKQTPKDEMTNEKSTASRQQKAVLIKKRENSARALASPGGNLCNIEPFEVGASSLSEDLQGRIANRAHEIYQRRGGHHGQDLADWFDAERQVLEEVQ